MIEQSKCRRSLLEVPQIGKLTVFFKKNEPFIIRNLEEITQILWDFPAYRRCEMVRVGFEVDPTTSIYSGKSFAPTSCRGLWRRAEGA